MDKLLLFFLVHFTCSTKANLFTKSSFSFVSEENYNCPEYGKLPYMFLNLTVTKYNVSHVIVNSKLSTDRAFTNKMTLSLELKQWQNDQWKNKISKVDRDQACTSVHVILGNIWSELCHASGITSMKCPIAKGTYIITNYLVDVASPPVLKMLSGRYKVIFRVHLNRTPIYCTEHILKITQ